MVGHGGNCGAVPASTSSFGVDPSQVSNWLATNFLKSDIDYQALILKLNSNWDTLADLVEKGVDLDFEHVIQTDARQIISDASEPGMNGTNTSPSAIQAIQFGIKFLTRMKAYPATAANANLGQEIQDKLDLLSKALAAMQTVCAASDDKCPNTQLKVIADLFDLRDGSQVFASAATDLVEIDLLHRLQRGEFPKNPAEVLRFLGNNISTTLAQSGLTDKNAINDDLNTAQSLTESNLRDFRNFFSDGFSDAVKREYSQTAGEDTAGPHRPHGELVGALCIQWLITGSIPISAPQTYQDWPNPTVASICEKAAIYSANQGKRSDGTYIPAISVSELVQQLRGKPIPRPSLRSASFRTDSRTPRTHRSRISCSRSPLSRDRKGID